MATGTPKIDKRRLSDHLALVWDAPVEVDGTLYPDGLAGHFLREWKHHNETGTTLDRSDFGTVLVLLFARLMDTLVEHLNRVPKKHFAAFLNMVGVERLPGSPARVPVTFTPAPKTPRGRHVPRGTQVATTQTKDEPAILFETEDGFDLTPAVLKHAFTVDPDSDRWRDVKAQLDDPEVSAASLFKVEAAGDAEEDRRTLVEHSLYLAHEGLFSLETKPDLKVRIEPAGAFDGLDLAWERFDGKEWVAMHWFEDGVSDDIVIDGFPGSEPSIVGEDDEARRWIRARLNQPLGAGETLPVVNTIDVSAKPPENSSRAPDAAFTNTFPIDLQRGFYPFGPRPTIGDTFYLACEEALRVPETNPPQSRRIYLELELLPIPGKDDVYPDDERNPAVTWQYFSRAHGWRAIEKADNVDDFEDGTENLVVPPEGEESFKEVSFTLPSDIAAVTVNGVKAHWLRASLTGGDYGLAAYVSFKYDAEGDKVIEYELKPESFRPPFLSGANLRVRYEVSGDESFAPEACKSINHFQVADHAAESDFRPYRTLKELGESSPVLYLGYDRPFGNFSIRQLLELLPPSPDELAAEAAGESPRWVWEHLGEDGTWRRLDATDGTRGLTDTGTLSFVAPAGMTVRRHLGTEACWLRLRLAGGHLHAPRQLKAVHLNTVWAKSVHTVTDELLGSGTGELPQILRLSQVPVLLDERILVRELNPPSDEALAELDEEEKDRARKRHREPLPVVVRRPNADSGEEEIWVRWYPKTNFRFSEPTSRHYVIDRVSGEITFGSLPGEPTVKAMPVPLGRDNVRAEHYQAHGGARAERAGTVDSVTQLMSSLPFVAGVRNPVAAQGGSAPETVAETLRRGPANLKHRNRAVTIEDFDALTREANTSIALVRTLPITNARGERKLGAVTVMIVPRSQDSEPQPTPELLDQVRRYLSDRAAETVRHRVDVIGPTYVPVSVKARVVAKDASEASLVTFRVVESLTQFLHPLTGGRDKEGWPFGRDVHISEIYALIEAVEGVDHVEHAEFEGGAAEVAVGDDKLVKSGTHNIETLGSAS